MQQMLAIVGVLALLMVAGGVAAAPPATMRVYVGTSGHDPRKGIYRLELDPTTGQFVGPPALVAQAEAPEFLAMSADGKFIYASNAKRGQPPRPADGTVDTYAVSADGSLRAMRPQPLGGDRGTFLLLDAAGRNLITVAYSSANVALLPIDAAGQLQPPTVVLQHKGSSVNHARQAEAHPHTVTLDPAGRFAFVPDLGCDQIVSYRVDSEGHTLTANDPPFVATPPGSGPRRICFTRAGRFAYAVTEMGVTAITYQYDAARGALTPVQETPLLSRPITAGDTGSEIALGADDRFVYASVRGQNVIVVLRRDPSDGKLTPLSWQSTLGKTPRHFAIDPAGRWLFVANQNSASVKAFKIDPATGGLSTEAASADIGSPTCVLFDRAAR